MMPKKPPPDPIRGASGFRITSCSHELTPLLGIGLELRLERGKLGERRIRIGRTFHPFAPLMLLLIVALVVFALALETRLAFAVMGTLAFRPIGTFATILMPPAMMMPLVPRRRIVSRRRC